MTNIEMKEIIGDFNNDLPKGKEYLTLVFSPSSIPLKQRWKTNGLSADFMADYFATFFPGKEGTTTEANLQAEVKSAVSFIGNELLENAMKFTDDQLDYPISLTLQMYSNKLVFMTTNSVDCHSVEKFQAFAQELTSSDISELYIRHFEKIESDLEASLPETSDSGLGLLTMINDYQAKLGWKFEAIQNESKVVYVTTMVQLIV